MRLTSIFSTGARESWSTDRSPRSTSSSGIELLLGALLVLATVPGVAAAESRAGGTIVVSEGETIDEDLSAFGGTIIVRGTVDGDVDAFGGDVRVEGAGVGLLALVAVPILLIAVAITIVGIPLAVVGGLLFALLLWVGLVYGRFAIGAWLPSLADVGNRWLGLVVGLLVLGLAALIPWIGGLVDFVVVLPGAVAALGYTGYRRRRA